MAAYQLDYFAKLNTISHRNLQNGRHTTHAVEN